jgi:uncharacterized protein YbaR (Trm112 family)
MKNVLIVDTEKDKSKSILYTVDENGKKTYILKGVFTEFSNKHCGRIYSVEDYLPHIEESKKRDTYGKNS